MNDNSIDKIYTIACRANCRAVLTSQFTIHNYRLRVLVNQISYIKVAL
jgi:hypothetical protein